MGESVDRQARQRMNTSELDDYFAARPDSNSRRAKLDPIQPSQMKPIRSTCPPS